MLSEREQSARQRARNECGRAREDGYTCGRQKPCPQHPPEPPATITIVWGDGRRSLLKGGLVPKTFAGHDAASAAADRLNRIAERKSVDWRYEVTP